MDRLCPADGCPALDWLSTKQWRNNYSTKSDSERQLLPLLPFAASPLGSLNEQAGRVSRNELRGMEPRHKILILDDETAWLEVNREMLAQLPSKPEIRTVSAGTRAVALLDAEQFRLLMCDLKMPKMDGLQVLAIVRRRFPELRTVVLTALEDEEFRSRAYALGVDLFWLKTDMQQNPKMFLDCVESLLGRDMETGFRGIQSKSLMDIIQMECLSRSSTVLRITRGPLVAKIWLQDGELIDAEAEGARGEAAFRRILAWKSGTFENLPAEPDHERTIVKPVDALLLESAQAMDENANPGPDQPRRSGTGKPSGNFPCWHGKARNLWCPFPPTPGEVEALGTQYGEQLAELDAPVDRDRPHGLGEQLEAGPLSHIAATAWNDRLVLLPGRQNLSGWPGRPARDRPIA